MDRDNPIPSRSQMRLSAAEPGRWLFRILGPATRAELCGGLAFLTVSLLGTAWVIKCRADALALERDSVNVDGKVIRLWVTEANNGHHYRVEYEYQVPPEPRVFRDKTELFEEHFNRLNEGGPIALKVCRTDLANHQALGEPRRLFSRTAALLVWLSLLGLLALAAVINIWWWWFCRAYLRPCQVLVVAVNNFQ
jgi:hypothetical protein